MARRYMFIEDPGHGWLSVPVDEIRRLGIAERISSCSYMTPTRAYLEEDCDAPAFLAAAGIAPADVGEHARTVYQENARCKSFGQYHPAWVREPINVGRAVVLGLGIRATVISFTERCGGRWIVRTAGGCDYALPGRNPYAYCHPAEAPELAGAAH